MLKSLKTLLRKILFHPFGYDIVPLRARPNAGPKKKSRKTPKQAEDDFDLSVYTNLFGKKAPSDVPQAELWMGAHPKVSSKVVCDGQRISLHELILKQP